MTVKPKYYFNLDGNISDGEKEYSLENIEDKIGGLSISSDLKDNYVLYGRNSLLKLINNFNDENEQLKKENEQLERENTVTWQENQRIIKEGVIPHQNTIQKLLKENEQLKQSNKEAIDLISEAIVEALDGARYNVEDLLEEAIELLGGRDD